MINLESILEVFWHHEGTEILKNGSPKAVEKHTFTLGVQEVVRGDPGDPGRSREIPGMGPGVPLRELKNQEIKNQVTLYQ